jgi:hypothetical protein
VRITRGGLIGLPRLGDAGHRLRRPMFDGSIVF